MLSAAAASAADEAAAAFAAVFPQRAFEGPQGVPVYVRVQPFVTPSTGEAPAEGPPRFFVSEGAPRIQRNRGPAGQGVLSPDVPAGSDGVGDNPALSDRGLPTERGPPSLRDSGPPLRVVGDRLSPSEAPSGHPRGPLEGVPPTDQEGGPLLLGQHSPDSSNTPWGPHWGPPWDPTWGS